MMIISRTCELLRSCAPAEIWDSGMILFDFSRERYAAIRALMGNMVYTAASHVIAPVQRDAML